MCKSLALPPLLPTCLSCKPPRAPPGWLPDENALTFIYCHVQVADADVLVPTTGTVDAQTIRSAKKLKLIVQPADGIQQH